MKKEKNKILIRAVDGGGTGFRRADVLGKEVKNLKKIGPVKKASQLVSFACQDLAPETKGIVYSMAGTIKNQRKIIKSPNIHLLDGVALADLTTQKSGKKTIICQDMEGTVKGMAKLLPRLQYFMGITWSSGIGLRIFKNGEILAGEEAGHIPLDSSPYAPFCGCGVQGCAESILGGQALKRRVIAETQTLGLVIPAKISPWQFLNKSFNKNEKWAIAIYDLVSTGMASFLAGIQSIFRLPAVVWRGTVAKNVLPRIEKDIRQKMRKKLINPDWEKEMKFFFSPDQEKDSFIGAAEIFLEL